MKSSSGALERWCAIPLSWRTAKAGTLPPAKPREASLGWTTWESDGGRAKELWELDTLPPVGKKNPRNCIELIPNQFCLVKFNSIQVNINKELFRTWFCYLSFSLFLTFGVITWSRLLIIQRCSHNFWKQNILQCDLIRND